MSNRKPCKECPWIVDSKNNKVITGHAKKYNKKHNCHMIPSEKRGGLWDVKEECVCKGAIDMKELEA